jgi:hypothetical protein
MATQNPKSAGKPASAGKAPPDKAASKPAKAEEDDLLEEALEESFPASDPMSSMHFTSSKDKKG